MRFANLGRAVRVRRFMVLGTVLAAGLLAVGCTSATKSSQLAPPPSISVEQQYRGTHPWDNTACGLVGQALLARLADSRTPVTCNKVPTANDGKSAGTFAPGNGKGDLSGVIELYRGQAANDFMARTSLNGYKPWIRSATLKTYEHTSTGVPSSDFLGDMNARSTRYVIVVHSPTRGTGPTSATAQPADLNYALQVAYSTLSTP